MTWLEVAAVIAALTLGATVQSAVGFGSAVVAAPLIALVDVTLLPLATMPQGLITNLAVARRDGEHADRPTVGRLLVGAVIGAVLAVPLLRVDEGVRQVLVAVIASSGAIGMGLRVRPTRAATIVAGVLSGIGGLLAGISGPAVLPVVPREQPARFRGTLAVYFLLVTPVQVVLLAASDLPLWEPLRIGALALPTVLAGIWLGHRLTRIARPIHVKVAVLVLAVAAAAGPILRAVR